MAGMKKVTLVQIMDEAIAMEEAGYNIYLRAKEFSKEALMKMVLASLAESEFKHKIAIQRFCKMKKLPQTKLATNIFGISKENLRKRINATSNRDDVYNFALDVERRGYDYYKKAKRQTKDKKALKLLNFLLKEEDAHYKLLWNTYQYITRPGEWFLQEEQPIVEG